MDKFVIFHVEGGLGKNVASTAIIKNIKKKYPDRKLIVMASFPEIFLNNPHIYRVYRIGISPYFWLDYVNNKDTIIFRREPYFESQHMTLQTSLVQTWHKMYDLPFNEKEDLPEMYMNMLQSSFANNYKRQKPVMVIQTHGGPIGDNQPHYAWTRDMPPNVMEAIVNNFTNQYHIIQICKQESQAIKHQGVEPIFRQLSNHELFSILQVSAKRVLIDSCMQHAAAALRLPSVVLWIGTKPETFGYSLHKNLKANDPPGSTKLVDSMYFDYQLSGIVHECPYNSVDEMFNVQNVMQEIAKF